MSGPLERLKNQLAEYGLRPQKRFGQNFLIDPNFAAAIARQVAPDERTVVLEAGPGTGALTRALLDAHPAARVLAVELDTGLARLLRGVFAPELAAGRLTLVEGDILEGKHGLNPAWVGELLRISEAEGRPRRVLGANLPYNAATPLLANLAEPHEACACLVERAVATIQKELAERLIAAPGTSAYGPLAAYLALRGRARIVRKVGPEVFWPRPQVHSAVLEIELPPWPQVALPQAQARAYSVWLHRLFQQRRKRIGGLLKGSLPDGHPAAERRAEALTPVQLWDLFGVTSGLNRT